MAAAIQADMNNGFARLERLIAQNHRDTTAKYDNLNKKVDKLDKKVDKLDTKVENLSTQVEKLFVIAGKHQTSIDELNAKQDKLFVVMDAQQTSVNKVVADMAEVKKEQSSLSERLTHLLAEITKLAADTAKGLEIWAEKTQENVTNRILEVRDTRYDALMKELDKIKAKSQPVGPYNRGIGSAQSPPGTPGARPSLYPAPRT
ncbi:hypothetical protein POSPLADRAFT_1065950 [Postia placenta MAD-698-R-SB12]|uniref:Autophagy-related protein 16 domain-containing protein n=1 Tax=Postia placenta MAD-698-R-SB12 TaxID=670580 RepID=A0A1X6N3A3_9APHY|nr:hypothetical protein POSPLADRAFT_1065950 [Postia placenta MAD-698-R-SB12]OSX62923.1 hypothetical protein POSPLADRAFT_1065950 [Postia placenta MAD-698-R-SB12]